MRKNILSLILEDSASEELKTVRADQVIDYEDELYVVSKEKDELVFYRVVEDDNKKTALTNDISPSTYSALRDIYAAYQEDDVKEY